MTAIRLVDGCLDCGVQIADCHAGLRVTSAWFRHWLPLLEPLRLLGEPGNASLSDFATDFLSQLPELF